MCGTVAHLRHRARVRACARACARACVRARLREVVCSPLANPNIVAGTPYELFLHPELTGASLCGHKVDVNEVNIFEQMVERVAPLPLFDTLNEICDEFRFGRPETVTCLQSATELYLSLKNVLGI